VYFFYFQTQSQSQSAIGSADLDNLSTFHLGLPGMSKTFAAETVYGSYNILPLKKKPIEQKEYWI
jgi:hypothetical protein